MNTFHTLMPVLAAGVLGGVCVTQAQGAPPLVIETVTVGNPGNAGDTQIQGIFGAVDSVYAIGKYEVTAGQYAGFLKAGTTRTGDTQPWDTSPQMRSSATARLWGAGLCP